MPPLPKRASGTQVQRQIGQPVRTPYSTYLAGRVQDGSGAANVAVGQSRALLDFSTQQATQFARHADDTRAIEEINKISKERASLMAMIATKRGTDAQDFAAEGRRQLNQRIRDVYNSLPSKYAQDRFDMMAMRESTSFHNQVTGHVSREMERLRTTELAARSETHLNDWKRTGDTAELEGALAAQDELYEGAPEQREVARRNLKTKAYGHRIGELLDSKAPGNIDEAERLLKEHRGEIDEGVAERLESAVRDARFETAGRDTAFRFMDKAQGNDVNALQMLQEAQRDMDPKEFNAAQKVLEDRISTRSKLENERTRQLYDEGMTAVRDSNWRMHPKEAIGSDVWYGLPYDVRDSMETRWKKERKRMRSIGSLARRERVKFLNSVARAHIASVVSDNELAQIWRMRGKEAMSTRDAIAWWKNHGVAIPPHEAKKLMEQGSSVDGYRLVMRLLSSSYASEGAISKHLDSLTKEMKPETENITHSKIIATLFRQRQEIEGLPDKNFATIKDFAKDEDNEEAFKELNQEAGDIMTWANEQKAKNNKLTMFEVEARIRAMQNSRVYIKGLDRSLSSRQFARAAAADPNYFFKVDIERIVIPGASQEAIEKRADDILMQENLSTAARNDFTLKMARKVARAERISLRAAEQLRSRLRGDAARTRVGRQNAASNERAVRNFSGGFF